MTKREEDWHKIVTDFRQACVLRRQGKEEESNTILRDQLPPRIAKWSKDTPPNGTNRRTVLEAMMREEQKRVEDAWVVHRMLADKLASDLIPTLCSEVADHVKGVVIEGLEFLSTASQNVISNRQVGDAPSKWTPVKRRIAFDDIPGIVDTIIHEQNEERFPGGMLTLKSS